MGTVIQTNESRKLAVAAVVSDGHFADKLERPSLDWGGAEVDGTNSVPTRRRPERKRSHRVN
jgi:hypothetical protein